MSRLTIDMTEQQHKSLKALAALQGKTIKQYTLERLFPSDETAEQAWQELQSLLKTRVHNGLTGKITSKGVSDLLAEELAEDGRD